jgi:predicted protein tyrosine phosphatase
MTYLSHVISKLYRPSSARQVFALSRADAERLPLLPTAAVISITTPEKGPAALPDFQHMLRLSFEDVDHQSSDLSARAKAKLSRSFTTQHAKQILQFVTELPAEIRTVVVHCEGGFSRSCAVASALHNLYGYTVEQQRLTQANPSVIAVILDTAQPKTRKGKGK